jgi:glycosyltransferase involved in cell wall biosynthesis
MWTWWIFCNDLRELSYCKNKGLNSCLIHQHAFVDMEKFCITNRNLDTRKYSAVYNAQFISFKRHILCAKIDACAVIGYGDANEYYNQVKSELEKCDFINEVSEDGKLLTISDINVNEIYNNSSVGLCLSKEEGGMYAAIEYLLSGIPIVTTLNKGGRDYFFDGRFVIHCDDDSSSINEAVITLKNAYISPEYIRSETIVKVKRERDLFFQFMEGKLGCENYSEIFLRKFYSSKLLDRNPLVELINKVRSLNG